MAEASSVASCSKGIKRALSKISNNEGRITVARSKTDKPVTQEFSSSTGQSSRVSLEREEDK